MTTSYVSQRTLPLLGVALLLAGLSACQPQQPSSAEPSQPTARATQPSSTPRAPVAEVVRVTVPQGTEVQVTLSTPIGSATSQVGDTLTATTTAPVVVGNDVAIPTGSTIAGRVTAVSLGTKGLKIGEKGGAVAVTFDTVTPPGGVSTPLSASLVRIAKSAGKTAGIIGGSAAGGALLGKIIGGDSEDVYLGAVLGGGIGTGIAAGTKGKELVIPAGTDLALTLDQPLTLDAQS